MNEDFIKLYKIEMKIGLSQEYVDCINVEIGKVVQNKSY